MTPLTWALLSLFLGGLGVFVGIRMISDWRKMEAHMRDQLQKAREEMKLRELRERQSQGAFGRRAWGRIYDEIDDERRRAHAKHGATSMDATPVDDMNRLAILLEEVGEVAFEFNEARHASRRVDVAKLRTELIQVAAMATAWADACSRDTPAPAREDPPSVPGRDECEGCC